MIQADSKSTRTVKILNVPLLNLNSKYSLGTTLNQ